MTARVILARWDNRQFNSAGRWLIRDIPGLAIFNSGLPGRPWRLHALKNEELNTLDGVRRSAEKIWGAENLETRLKEARLFLEANPDIWQQGFSSLGEARIALGETIYPAPKSRQQLGRLLDEA